MKVFMRSWVDIFMMSGTVEFDILIITGSDKPPNWSQSDNQFLQLLFTVEHII